MPTIIGQNGSNHQQTWVFATGAAPPEPAQVVNGGDEIVLAQIANLNGVLQYPFSVTTPAGQHVASILQYNGIWWLNLPQPELQIGGLPDGGVTIMCDI